MSLYSWLKKLCSLRDSDLDGVDLEGSSFRGASFEDSCFYEAKFLGARFGRAYFGGANFACATFQNARFQGADFREADLSGALLGEQQIRDLVVDGVRVRHALNDRTALMAPMGDAPQRLATVAAIVLSDPSNLDMTHWHNSSREGGKCKTTHCLAGWAIHLAGPLGAFLEDRFGAARAGEILLGKEAASFFYADNATALAYLRSVLDKATAEKEVASVG